MSSTQRVKWTEKSPESRNDSSAISSTFDERAHIHSLTFSHNLAWLSSSPEEMWQQNFQRFYISILIEAKYEQQQNKTKMVETIKCKK